MTSFSPARPPPFTWRDALLSLAIYFAALHLFWHSPILNMGDSKYTLLLTHNLLSKGSFVLDGYHIPLKKKVQVDGATLDSETYQIEIVAGHLYDYFPPGSAILSAPFVWIGEKTGHSVLGPDGVYSETRESSIQHYVASILMALLAVIFYGTTRLLLPVGWSLVIALGGALGTQVWSTASRALWGHTWGIALLGSVLCLLLASETGRRKLPPVLLATLLSWAYFVRPTNSIFIVGITVYVLARHRRAFIPYALTGAAWCAAFVAYSWTHFGKLLPNYYQAGRLSTAHLPEALAGNLISPSRGTLIFVPVSLFVVYLIARYWRQVPCRPLVWLAAVVSLCHLLAVSCFTPWFGGWCYGPRYTTELVPWLVLLAVLGVRATLDRREDYSLPPYKARAWQATMAAGCGLLLLSIWINRRGAVEMAAVNWNEYPVLIDTEPDRVWNWRYPQILAGIISPPLPAKLPAIDGRRIDFGQGAGRAFQLDGWAQSDPASCWSEGRQAKVIFTADELASERLRLCFAPYLHGRKVPRQRITIRLNDQIVADFVAREPVFREYVFGLPPGLLRHDNVLTLTLPDAASPLSVGEGDDPRLLGIALRWMELKGAGTP